jgi:hypothetical protein
VHRRGLVSSIGLGWTPVPSVGSCVLGSGEITAAAGERQRRRESNGEMGEKNDGYVLYGVLILF